MFIQYYNKLIEYLRDYADELFYSCMVHRSSTDHHFHMMRTKDASKVGILLARLAIQLYYDNTHSFYKMLELMQYDIPDGSVKQLAIEIHKKVRDFDPLISSGTAAKHIT